MTPVARITVQDNCLQVQSPVVPDITRGRHRLFFTSVAGFEVAMDFVGYIIPLGAETPKLIEDVQIYLGQEAIASDLDPSAAAILRVREHQEQELEAACQAGARIREGVFERPQPPGFRRALMPYQEPAVAHLLAVRHAANFSVPGSGKTTMVLAAYAELRASCTVENLLVIGPRASFLPWEDEFEECFGRRPNSVRLSGTRPDRRAQYRKASAPETDLVLATYQMAANDAESLLTLLQKQKVMMVLDESHYIKRLAGGVWATSLLQLGPYAAKRVVLTGTPVPNGLADLWSQMTFLWPTPPVLGSREKFQSRIAPNDESVTEQIREEIRPLYWRTKKSDVRLPVPAFHRIPIPMRPYQRAIYDALATKVLAEVERRPSEREKLRQWRKARMVRLLQAASNPSLLTEYSPEFRIPALSASGLSVEQVIENYSQFEMPAKLDFARDLVSSLARRGHKVVIWTSFVHNIRTLERLLVEFNPSVVYGGVPKDADEDEDFNREVVIRRFKTEERYPVLIANPGACAESISLHRVCKHAVYLDRTFNGAQYMQSLDRIHRLGLSENDKIHYHILNAEQTIDEVIDRRLEEKQARLLMLMEDDLAPVDLDPSDEFSEEDEEAKDFEELIAFLRKKHTGQPLA